MRTRRCLVTIRTSRLFRPVGAVATALALALAPAGLGCGPASSPHSYGPSDASAPPPSDSRPPPVDARDPRACASGGKTMLSGTVVAPNGVDPVPKAIVYVPERIDDFPPQVSCELCRQITSAAVISTVTAPSGSFTLGPLPVLDNHPPGTLVTVVVQKGRFRRVVNVPIEHPCADNSAPAQSFRLPGQSSGADHVPRIAVASGYYDAMECVLAKLGLAESAFDIFDGIKDGSGPRSFATLLRDADLMKSYNVIFINCSASGNPMMHSFEELLAEPAVLANLEGYVRAGGRLYVTDLSYDFVEQVPEWSARIDFAGSSSGSASPEELDAAEVGAADITTEAKVHDSGLAEWLRAVAAVTHDSSIISQSDTVHIEHFLDGWAMQLAVPSDADTTVWLSGQVSGDRGRISGDLPLTTTIDYQQCGRVLYSSYHTAGREDAPPLFVAPFPDYCSRNPTLSPQERVLEYLILHVADCLVID